MNSSVALPIACLMPAFPPSPLFLVMPEAKKQPANAVATDTPQFLPPNNKISPSSYSLKIPSRILHTTFLLPPSIHRASRCPMRLRSGKHPSRRSYLVERGADGGGGGVGARHENVVQIAEDGFVREG